MKIPDNTKIQNITLRVYEPQRMLDFYESLGLNNDVVKIIEDKNARPAPGSVPGLYHTAFRYPTRKALAKIFIKLHNAGTKFQGFSDHLVSEAIYLSDPEMNGVELYADRPKKEWKWKDGEIEMATKPLNLTDLTKELENDNDDDDNKHPDVGHIHLKVSGLDKAKKFYHDILGFDITTESYSGALFFSAGRYHHHIGTNIWHSRNAQPAPEDAPGLESFTINIPDEKYIKGLIKKFNDSNIEYEETKEGVKTSDYDKIKIIISTLRH